jgi:mono/diheme cytochrome c family protein
MRTLLAVVGLAFGLTLPAAVRAAEAVLTLSLGPETRTFTTGELLARPDAATLTVPADVAYHRPMTYRVVPLLALLGKVDGSQLDTLEGRATDGFASQLPLALVENGADGGSVAWIAVEDPAAPWPHLPDKSVGAGPFYLVWEHPERSGVGSEQWPYRLASLTGVQSPARRWPQMAVDARLPADAPARHGQAVFTTQCLPCHRMKGAGASDVGPDLGVPMNPVRYLTPEGLRLLIRNPKAVRTWRRQEMPGFDEAMLPEADLDALIAYLAAMGKSKH